MKINRPIAVALAPLAAVAVLGAVPAPAAHASNVAPKIVAATMMDTDLDDKADRVKLTYSEAINHALDTSSFPFKVAGYTVTKVSSASASKTLYVYITEKATADIAAVPTVSYAKTSSQAVKDTEGLQALAQTFSGTKPVDTDLDGYASADCKPIDPAVNPAAGDRPDLSFVDSDCDGIDGDSATAIFVNPNDGQDVNPGTKALPVRTMAQAFNLRSATRNTVLVTVAIYSPNAANVTVPDGVGIFGGYDTTWKRSHTPTGSNGLPFVIAGTSELQLLKLVVANEAVALKVTGTATLGEVSLENALSDKNSIALAVTNGGKVTATRGSITSGRANWNTPPLVAIRGGNGSNGLAGEKGGAGSCDTWSGGDSGDGGGYGKFDAEAIGGNGGFGGSVAGNGTGNGQPGKNGSGGAIGGTGGSKGDPGKAGGNGASGTPGVNGATGAVVKGAFAMSGYVPATSNPGTAGANGGSGAGGGGGGGQVGVAVLTGVGNGGGGGGQGGMPGTGGRGGKGGHASIAVYVPLGSVTLNGTTITTGTGGNSEVGGAGGTGGQGGAGGKGGSSCLTEVGRGGDGGSGARGGNGGKGGDGQGGPSIGIYTGPYAAATTTGVTYTIGAAGTGPQAIRATIY
ncbi:MAG: hypothetical protein NTX33_14075 [Propionibacteriales bacterium]|nr:hypothetical protein [Propionibacteriales bacterium]